MGEALTWAVDILREKSEFVVQRVLIRSWMMEAGNPAQEFVDEEVPASLRHLFPSLLRRAYVVADDIIDRHLQFQTPGGRFQRGDLIMICTAFELEKLVESGDLPFDGRWEDFAKPTGKHYVLRSRRACITTSQVEDPSKKPRNAVHRTNYGEMNDLFLFEEMRVDVAADERRHLLFLHGYQDLNFAHIAYPHPEKNRHIYRTNNLMWMPHEATSDLPPQEGPPRSPDPEAIENVERYLRDNDD